MVNIKYPKIETLYNRNPTTFKINQELRLEEFGLINKWLITEKIDGTNVRVILEQGKVSFAGRTDKAQMPPFLLNYLVKTFPEDKIQSVFDEGVKVTLFGEGYGVKIQKGGNYRKSGVSFRLFDVALEEDERIWWLNWGSVEDVANKLNIQTVPILTHSGAMTDGRRLCRAGFSSHVSIEEANKHYTAEGVVARTEPLLYRRNGQRLIWKLKHKDF